MPKVAISTMPCGWKQVKCSRNMTRACVRVCVRGPVKQECHQYLSPALCCRHRFLGVCHCTCSAAVCVGVRSVLLGASV